MEVVVLKKVAGLLRRPDGLLGGFQTTISSSWRGGGGADLFGFITERGGGRGLQGAGLLLLAGAGGRCGPADCRVLHRARAARPYTGPQWRLKLIDFGSGRCSRTPSTRTLSGTQCILPEWIHYRGTSAAVWSLARVSSEQHLIRWCLALSHQIGHPSKKSRTSRGCKISLLPQETAEISLHRLSPGAQATTSPAGSSLSNAQGGKCLVSSFSTSGTYFQTVQCLIQKQHLQLHSRPQALEAASQRAGGDSTPSRCPELHFSHRSSPSH